jgi:hypothetical protein
VAALVMVTAYRLGVLLFGAGVLVLVALAFPEHLSAEPSIRLLTLGLVAVVGAVLAHTLERIVLVSVTACYGAFMAASALAGLGGSHPENVLLPPRADQLPSAPWFLAAWAALAICGLLAQFRSVHRRGD